MTTDARSPATESPAETPETPDGSDAPAAAAEGTVRDRTWVLPGATLVVGLLGLVAALLMPFAPVVDHDTTVTWPRAGKDVTSTTAFFVPYAPESVRLDVPCPVVRAALGRDGPTTIVSSDRPGADTTGFTVTTVDQNLLVLVGGRQLYREPVADGDACGIGLRTDGAGSTVTPAGQAPRTYPGDRVRTVRVFATDLAPPDAAGLRVVARTADWFTADSTGTKDALVVVQLLLAAASLALLALADRQRRRRRSLAGTRRIWRATALESWATVRGLGRKAVDLAVLGVLGVWTVIGPLSPDDGFTEGIVRNAAGTDQFGNFYRWGNASEAPFTLVLRLVQPMVDDGASPLALRTLSTIAGVAVWLLVSRVALPVLLGRLSRRVWVRLLLAVCLLVWWMPLNLGVRPEPFAALAVTATVAFGLRAAARPRHGGVWLGLAALAFGTSVAVTPSSVMVLGPVLVLLPALLRRVRGTATGLRGLFAQAGATAAAAAIGGVGLVLIFTGQSWYTVSRATEMHTYFGPNVAWFDEIRRWTLLFGFDGEQGGLGRRIPVLLTIALLVAVLPLLARGVHRTAGLRWVPVVTVGAALGLVALGLTPSKWTHYFGTLAGVGALGLTCGVVLLVLAARRRADETAVRAAAGAGTLALVIAAAVAFSGRNDWFLYSHWGVPHDDGPFRPWNSPVPWVAVVVAVLLLGAVVAAVRTGDNRAGARDGLRRGMVRAPAVLTASVALVGVAAMLWSFAVAPGRQEGSYSVGAQMIAQFDGTPTCGILDDVDVVTNTPGGVLAAGPGTARTTGFTQNGGYRGTPPAPPGTGSSQFLWGSADRGASSTGSLTSQWFVLPALADDQELALDVNGRTGQGNSLSLEFAPPGDGSAPPLGTRVIDDAATDPASRADYPADHVEQQTPLFRSDWRDVHLSRDQIPAGAGLVRIRATDATTDPGGFLAVTGPRLRDVRPARDEITAGDTTYVDWSLLWAAPCVRKSPRVADGLAGAPTVLLRGPADLDFAGDASFAASVGGAFAPMTVYDTESRLPTRLRGTDTRPRYDDWGSITRVTYPYPTDAYDRATTPVERWGWEGDRTPLGYPEIPAP
ncbi:arabinosyltransferase domain-containing protein [Pseudonocardia endophytica]|uniref:Arabinosyltransferase C n=1 Tax=Pseudonocardia endophytica TaxID=401976 RepID=A0A4R1I561_PSEEN|nr:arabinosyltransferase domain-containing protein [Pseudonocardia endophytica]TCK25162.1 arabinosyltransferase C [Pseudonocardia endophytica]